ncbi:hypothetical protein LINPERHAP1_LOCUS20052, partial [Linum perenne]
SSVQRSLHQELDGPDKHTFREGNHAADFLADIGYDYPLGSHTISTSDSRLGHFLRYDCMGITELRSVLIND